MISPAVSIHYSVSILENEMGKDAVGVELVRGETTVLRGHEW